VGEWDLPKAKNGEALRVRGAQLPTSNAHQLVFRIFKFQISNAVPAVRSNCS